MNFTLLITVIVFAAFVLGYVLINLVQKSIDKDRAALATKLQAWDDSYSIDTIVYAAEPFGGLSREEKIKRIEAHIAALDREILKGDHDTQGMFLIQNKKITLLFKITRLYDAA